MPTTKGFVSSLQVRSDGWVEVELLSPHAGNARQRFFLRDLDGAPGEANRRLSQVGLLRDALARSLPVEIEYRSDKELGDVIEDVTVNPRASLDGRRPGPRVSGTVIGLAVTEVDASSGASPYRDPADRAWVTLLEDDGSVVQCLVDLQRPDPLAAQQMMVLLVQAQRTRRPVTLTLGTADGGRNKDEFKANAGTTLVVVAVEHVPVPATDLHEVHAFIERLTQRSESYDGSAAAALSHVRVQYTTAPAQTPEGDVSDNGSFQPAAGTAWLHGDSPLLKLLHDALLGRLMVRLGLREDRVHEVVLVAPLGSAARPVWIEMRRRLLPPPAPAPTCDNVPTVRAPDAAGFDTLQASVAWVGHGYFAPGVWRFVVITQGEATLTIDCRPPCREEPAPRCEGAAVPEPPPACCTPARSDRHERSVQQHHAYLDGMHRVEVVLSGRACRDPFELRAYRIR